MLDDYTQIQPLEAANVTACGLGDKISSLCEIHDLWY